jgi:hypothetical protein
MDVTRQAQMPRFEPTDEGRAAIELELPERCALLAHVDEGTRVVGPLKCHREVDPLNLLLGLQFGSFLRNQHQFSSALAAANKYEHGWDAPERDPTRDPSRMTLARAAGKLDVVGLLLMRRELRADRLLDLVLSFNLFSDSSPTTSEELQGMVLEIVYKSEDVVRTILPGSVLFHGQFNAVAKGMALVYALWLVAGPFFCRHGVVI